MKSFYQYIKESESDDTVNNFLDMIQPNKLEIRFDFISIISNIKSSEQLYYFMKFNKNYYICVFDINKRIKQIFLNSQLSNGNTKMSVLFSHNNYMLIMKSLCNIFKNFKNMDKYEISIHNLYTLERQFLK